MPRPLIGNFARETFIPMFPPGWRFTPQFGETQRIQPQQLGQLSKVQARLAWERRSRFPSCLGAPQTYAIAKERPVEKVCAGKITLIRQVI